MIRPMMGLCLLALSAAQAQDAVDAGRVRIIAPLLPEKAMGVGEPISNRAAWREAASHPAFARVVADAEALLGKAMPALTDELYLDYSRTGNRSRWQSVASRRHRRVPSLVLAECLEDRGRFLPAIEEALLALCDEKTWVMPAHDRGMRSFKGELQHIDLMVAGESWNLATARYWLGERLSPPVRERLRAELEKRCFTPFERSLRTGKPSLSWLTVTSNWNAVCLAGVVGAALATIEDRERRAFIVAAAEHYIANFLRGFSGDGYCSEGLGYWNYGFGHFAMLAECLRRASGGELDLLAGERIARIARFPRRMRLQPRIYPAFADCKPDQQPDGVLCAFLSRRLGFGWKALEERSLGLDSGPSSQLFRIGLYGFAGASPAPAAVDAGEAEPPLRDWFPDACILICRPAAARRDGLAAAMKGGHNAEHHNHNDVGSYLLAVGGGTPLVDPGGEVYTRRTFSSRRYESQVLSSFGHPVPRVAGRLQETGGKRRARILKSEFGDEQDVLVLDLAAAYAVKELKRLERSFRFSREGRGSLHVQDEVEFASPQAFESALVTFSPWKRLAADRLRVGEGAAAVEVRILAEGGSFAIEALEIHEDLPGKRIPVRIAIAFEKPVRRAVLGVLVTPAPESGR